MKKNWYKSILLNEPLTKVEIWSGNYPNGWQNYDCPDNGLTVKDYAEWCIGADSDYFATINNSNDVIRLNGWYVINGADYYDNEGNRI